MNKPTYITGTVQALAYRILRSHVAGVLEAYDLTPTHWAMLGVIVEARDGVRQAEIAKALHVKPPLITNMAKLLEDKGVMQSVTNQFDARAKLLALTPAGKKFVKTVETDLNDHLQQLLQGVTAADMEIYHKVLVTIIANDEAVASPK